MKSTTVLMSHAVYTKWAAKFQRIVSVTRLKRGRVTIVTVSPRGHAATYANKRTSDRYMAALIRRYEREQSQGMTGAASGDMSGAAFRAMVVKIRKAAMDKANRPIVALAHARTMLAKAERRRKLATTLERKWRRKVRAMERRMAKAAAVTDTTKGAD